MRDYYDDYRRPQGRNGGHNKRRRKKHRRNAAIKTIPLFILLIGIIVVALVIAGSGALEDLSYSDKKADMSEVLGTFSSDKAIVVKNGEYTEETVALINGAPYLEYETVKSDYVGRFYMDTEKNDILYTNEKETLRTAVGSSSYGVTGSENMLTVPATTLRGETLYMSFDFISLFSDLSYELKGGDDGMAYRIEVLKESESVSTATLKKDHAVRIEASKRGKVITKPGKGAKVRLVQPAEEEVIASGWTKVMTEDLLIGYIEEKDLENENMEMLAVNEAPKVNVEQISLGEDVVLGWSLTTSIAGNDYIVDEMNSAPGMNVVSPTWFYLNDNDGSLGNFASKDYVSKAHSKGLKVWAMVDNFTNNKISTATILNSETAREKIISQLMSYVDTYNLDGLNIDFETLSSEVGESFIQFIRELSIKTHEKGIVLSVDNYVPKEYNTKVYNRSEQGIFADYVIIMGYDEHVNSSAEAGSVASLPFVTEGIDKTLEEVPKERVINALPFYTRMYTVKPKTELEMANAPEGSDGNPISYNITEVQTIDMQLAIDAVNERSNAIKRWDEECAQNYAEWSNGSTTTRIWLEDAKSLDAKLQVMKDRGIAGCAVWRLSYSQPFAWRVIGDYY